MGRRSKISLYAFTFIPGATIVCVALAMLAYTLNANARDQASVRSASTSPSFITGVEPNLRWKKLWGDEFNGKEPQDKPECFDGAAVCLDESGTVTACPETVKTELTSLNKCNWGIVKDKFHDPAEIAVSGGQLHLNIRAKTEDGKDCSSATNSTCTIQSGSLSSKAVALDGGAIHGVSGTFGRFEMRARIPQSSEVQPKFFLVPQDKVNGHPYDSRIDVLYSDTIAPYFPKSALHLGDADTRTHHFKSFLWPASSEFYPDAKMLDTLFTDTFHEYAVEWDPLTIRFFVDKWQIGQVKKGEVMNKGKDGEKPFLATIPFNVMHMLLDTEARSVQDPLKMVKQQTEIDYIRVYSACDDASDKECKEVPDAVSGCTDPCNGLGRFDGFGCRYIDIPDGLAGKVSKRKFYVHPDHIGWVFTGIACGRDQKKVFMKGCEVGVVPEGREGYVMNDKSNGSRFYLKPVCKP